MNKHEYILFVLGSEQNRDTNVLIIFQEYFNIHIYYFISLVNSCKCDDNNNSNDIVGFFVDSPI